jgi:hypothetical protein
MVLLYEIGRKTAGLLGGLAGLAGGTYMALKQAKENPDELHRTLVDRGARGIEHDYETMGQLVHQLGHGKYDQDFERVYRTTDIGRAIDKGIVMKNRLQSYIETMPVDATTKTIGGAIAGITAHKILSKVKERLKNKRK